MRFRSILFLAAGVLFSLALSAQTRAKYVFYFIGDGMGVNQVNMAETYQAALEGRIGTSPLCFPSFPVVGLVNTQSATNGVTDSAAAGTALSCGQKTRNHTLGLSPQLTDTLQSVAAAAQRHGAAVGVTTSVSVDHATPAAFYAHVPERDQYHDIGHQLIRSGYDFFGGSDFRKPEPSKDHPGEASLLQGAGEQGYTVVRGYRDYVRRARGADKVVLLQPTNPSNGDKTCLPYALDRQKQDLCLADITRAALTSLSAKAESGRKQGFFLMVEGGKIDYACHANDAATVIKETIDMDQAVRVAYEFYRQHPDETLIVVTADHETGGLVLGRGAYELQLASLRYQRMSTEQYTRHLGELRSKLAGNFTWDAVKRDLREQWGFWDKLTLTDQQTERLHRAYQEYAKGQDAGSENLYSRLDGLSDAARRTMAELAMVGWQSGGHSDGYVPVFAVGVGAEQFTGRMENTLIPQKIRQIAGWE